MRFNDLIFPNVVEENWQMMPWERIALTGILSRLKPRVTLEVGVYHGGSLSLTSQYAEHIYALDIDPDVPSRFKVPENVTLTIGDSLDLIPKTLSVIKKNRIPMSFVLIDADHSTLGVKRDIESVLEYQVEEPMIILMHDSGHTPTRDGIKSADWGKNRFVQFVDLDFVPGQIIEHSVSDGYTEVWGGFALAYLDPSSEVRQPRMIESAKTSVEALNSFRHN